MSDESHAPRRRDAPAPESAGMTRKRFLWTLGAGTAAIAGHFLVPSDAFASPDPRPNVSIDGEPWLRSEVIVHRDGEGLALTCPGRARPCVCVVNGAGADVVRHLDGRTSVSEIARALAERAGTGAVTEVEVKVACFVAQLAELGFLRGPYYALIAERVDG